MATLLRLLVAVILVAAMPAAAQDEPPDAPATTEAATTGNPKEDSEKPEIRAVKTAIDAALRVNDIEEAERLVTTLTALGAAATDTVAARSSIRTAEQRRKAGFTIIGTTVFLIVAMVVSLRLAFRSADGRRRAATTYAFSLYLMIPCLGVVAALLLPPTAYFMLGHFGETFRSEAFQQQIYLIVLSCALGALGGAMNISLEVSARNPCPEDRVPPFSYYFFAPFNGLFMGGVMYIALKSGQLILFGVEKGESAVTAIPSVWAVAILSLVTGLFAEQAKERLRRLGVTILGDDGDAEEAGTAPTGEEVEGRDTAGETAVLPLKHALVREAERHEAPPVAQIGEPPGGDGDIEAPDTTGGVSGYDEQTRP